MMKNTDLVDTNDMQAQQIENLTLYIQWVEEHHPEVYERMEEHFEGLPGYAP